MNKLYTLEVTMKVSDPDGMELTSTVARFQGPSLNFIRRVAFTCSEEMHYIVMDQAQNAQQLALEEDAEKITGVWVYADEASRCAEKCKTTGCEVEGCAVEGCCSCPSV